MNICFNALLRAAGIYGIIAFILSLVLGVVSRESFLDDDPYIIGASGAVVTCSISFISLIVEQTSGKKRALVMLAAMYFAFLVYCSWAFFTAELHGPALAALWFISAISGALIDLFVLRRIPSLIHHVSGITLAMIHTAAWVSTYNG
jgi:hypothetical protein